MNPTYLDCCSTPQPETVKALYKGRHGVEALQQCKKCKQYWFYRYHEYVTFENDDWTIWYSVVDDQEAQSILKASGRPDLSFLKNKPSFMEEEKGVKKVTGQPTEPWH